jgi:hypothetical protein
MLFANGPLLTCHIKSVRTFVASRLDFSARILAAVINCCQGFCGAASLFAVRCTTKKYLQGMPPTLFMTCTLDMMLSDTTVLHRAFLRAG